MVKDVPSQSTFQFDYIFPFAYYEATQAWAREAREDWADNGFQIYVQLQPGATEAGVNNNIKYIISYLQNQVINNKYHTSNNIRSNHTNK